MRVTKQSASTKTQTRDIGTFVRNISQLEMRSNFKQVEIGATDKQKQMKAYIKRIFRLTFGLDIRS